MIDIVLIAAVEPLVQGNRAVSTDMILLIASLDPGASSADVEAAAQRVMKMGLFRSVTGKLEAGRPVLVVVENPFIKDVALEGVTQLDAKKLQELFKPLCGKPVNYELLKDAVSAMIDEYRHAGYTLAKVSGIDGPADATGTLEITLAEGRVAEVVFRGYQKTPEPLLRKALTTHPGDVFNYKASDAEVHALMKLETVDKVFVSFEPGGPTGVRLVYQITEK